MRRRVPLVDPGEAEPAPQRREVHRRRPRSPEAEAKREALIARARELLGRVC